MSGLREFLGSKFGGVVCLAFAALGVYLLWTHAGHAISALSYVLLLACPLLHFFGHGHRHVHQGGRALPDPEK
jgi:hypothetical protein